MTALLQYQGLEAIALQAADGARAVVTLHGGHVVSWMPAGGEEMLYLSPRSAFAAGQAIRGGVPVIFPQFSNRGPLLRHGFARVLPWQLVRHEVVQGHAEVGLRLTDTASTRLSWNHGFELGLTVRIGGARLMVALSCRNTGASAFDFSAALHTYVRTDDIDRSCVRGLAGHAYWDALDGTRSIQEPDMLCFDGELDRVYADVAGALDLHVQRGGREHRVTVDQRGFQDVVVWNPGAVKCAALADMPADGWREMLCVEAARVERPVVLQPGECWTGEQRLLHSCGQGPVGH
jgi:glucose-6-phosphate 1-epimerase